MSKKVVISLQDSQYEMLGSTVNVLYDTGNGLQSFFGKADNETKSFALLVRYLSKLNKDKLPQFDERTFALQSKHLYSEDVNVKDKLIQEHGEISGLSNIDAFTEAEPTQIFDLINNLKNALNDVSVACPLYFTNGEQTLLLNEEALSQIKGVSTDKKDEEALNAVFNLVDNTLTQTLSNSAKAR